MGRASNMAILLWWTLASIGVSLFLGAVFAYGQRGPKTLDTQLLDLDAQVRRPSSADSGVTQAHLT